MQERRRKEITPSRGPSGEEVRVPEQYWDEMDRLDMEKVGDYALAKNHPPRGLVLPFLGEVIMVDRVDRCLKRLRDGNWEPIAHRFMELLFLVYLLKVGPEPVTYDLISVKGLKDAHFFQGPHELTLAPLLERYGDDPLGFKKAGEFLGGEAQDMADVAFRILVFPKVPVYYLFWEGDEEFKPRISVLLDRSVEKHLSADAIWGIVNLVSDALLRVPEAFF